MSRMDRFPPTGRASRSAGRPRRGGRTYKARGRQGLSPAGIALAAAAAFAGTWAVADHLEVGAPAGPAPATLMQAGAGDRLSASFTLCHTGGGANCIVDGDTFWFGREKYRIADIDTPETHPPRCAREAELGEEATQRLQVLMNAGPFTLEAADRDADRYGRKLRIVTRGGESIGDQLVAEGLAREWNGRREPWC